MRELFFKAGRPILADVTEPDLTPGRVLVETHYSAVSPGTETGLLASSGRTFLSLALEKRHRIDRLWHALKRRDLDDLRVRFHRLAGRRQEWSAPGYSAAGVVLAVGREVTSVAPGDRVAVAGSGYAVHAERIIVPKNLVVPVPPSVSLEAASTVALGAIALQAVRRADSRVGETVFVLGLGLLGQMTARILRASGCRVLCWDPHESRCALAAVQDLEALAVSTTTQAAEAVMALTGGWGADQVIVAAAGGQEVVESGARATRRSGTLVLLGNTPVSIQRETAYERELQIRLSTSYGPGRYDPRYEEDGIDYPFAHVRWSEARNMLAWLELLASRRVHLDDLIAEVRDLDDAVAAYLELRLGALASLGLVFRYPAAVRKREVEAVLVAPARPGAIESGAHHQAPPDRKMDLPLDAFPNASLNASASASPGASLNAPLSAPLRVAVLGTGGYASQGILPSIVRLEGKTRLELLVGSSPARREVLARRFSFARVGSRYEEGAVDPGIDLVVVVTRHDSHADLVTRALESGHAVFCEKPLALSPAEVDRIESSLSRGGQFLAVGFNRRFAPPVMRLRRELAKRSGPIQIAYRVQAGALPEGHWMRGPEGGGRLVGEAVHMIDLVRSLVGSPLQRGWVVPGGSGREGDPAADNFQIGLRYEDGSTATILYTSRGSSRHPKERLELHWDGRSLELDNFTLLKEAGRRTPLWSSPQSRKGQDELWEACVDALLKGKSSPTPASELLETSRVVLALEQARRGT